MVQNARYPAAIGFYPSDKQELILEIEDLFTWAKRYIKEKNIQISKYIPKILISPHAGYMYSGKVAAVGYYFLSKTLQQITQLSQSKANSPQEKKLNFIIIGPAHTVYTTGLVIDNTPIYLTPIGKVYTNQKLINKFEQELPIAYIDPQAHEQEHSIEVQLPFLKYIFDVILRKKLDFNIVPIVTGKMSEKDYMIAAEFLTKILQDKNTYLIISTDLSHYLEYSFAKLVDTNTIKNIITLNQKLITPEQACGFNGINIAKEVAKHLRLKPQLLIYLNSGDTSGNLSQVVGYTSIIFNKD